MSSHAFRRSSLTQTPSRPELHTTYDDIEIDSNDDKESATPEGPQSEQGSVASITRTMLKDGIEYYVTEFNQTQLSHITHRISHHSRPASDQTEPGTQVDIVVCFIRYSRFEQFDRELHDLFPGVPFPPFPPKSYSIFRNHSDDFVESRRLALNQYLQTIVKQFPSVLMSPPFADLLKLR